MNSSGANDQKYLYRIKMCVRKKTQNRKWKNNLKLYIMLKKNSSYNHRKGDFESLRNSLEDVIPVYYVVSVLYA